MFERNEPAGYGEFENAEYQTAQNAENLDLLAMEIEQELRDGEHPEALLMFFEEFAAENATKCEIYNLLSYKMAEEKLEASHEY